MKGNPSIHRGHAREIDRSLQAKPGKGDFRVVREGGPILLAALALLASCANPSVLPTAAKQYYEDGIQAEKAGDLVLAEKHFARAYANAQISRLGPEAEARYLYEYARMIGYAGSHAEAERSFLKVLTLIDEARGSAHALRVSALTEYARLLHDTRQHRKAVPVYEKAVVEWENTGMQSSSPLGYAALLDDYAVSLATLGLTARAAAIAARSTSLKAEHASEPLPAPARRYRILSRAHF